MRKFKTAEDNRTNYIYYFNDGTSYTITPGENGENATIISQLHGMDDEELDRLSSADMWKIRVMQTVYLLSVTVCKWPMPTL